MINQVLIFILRVILAMAFSVVLTRIFHPEQNIIFIVGVGSLLVILAYVLEYFRKKSANNNGENER